MLTPNEQLDAIYAQNALLDPRVEKAYQDIMAQMAEDSVTQVDCQAMSRYEELIISKYFHSEIAPLLAPQIIDRHHPFPFLGNKELYIGLRFESSDKKIHFAIIPVNLKQFDRYFVFQNEANDRTAFVLVEDLILFFADTLFKKITVQEKFIFRITRNGDIRVNEALYDQDIDWRSQMEELFSKRKKSAAVRMQVSGSCSEEMEAYLVRKLGITAREVVRSHRLPLDLGYIYSLFGRLESKFPYHNYTPLPSLMPPSVKPDEPIIDRIAHGEDVLLAFPFHSMRPFLNLLDEAAVDPSVISIKITLYRVASDSKVAAALIKAAENGKDVLVMVELRARFDEEHNIHWSKQLEDAGCTVIYGMEDYKVHSKLLVITRKIGNRLSYITQIGTGNYNEKTSKIYTDYSLLTSNTEIALEGLNVFQNLQMGQFVEHSQYLLVAPLQMKNRLIEMVRKEAEEARQGRSGRIIVKCNGLSDRELICELVQASQAGVQITLYVRGICCVRAGVPGFTDNITIKSVVGRFLEHPRIYVFGEGQREKIYISSADWMTRNTSYRVEVGVEILREAIKCQIRDALAIIEQDNMQVRIMQPDGTYKRLYPGEGEEPVNSQMAMYDYFRRASEADQARQASLAEQERTGILGWLKKRFGK